MPAIRVFFLIGALSIAGGLHGQRERQVPAPEENGYGTRFFDQLRTIFGRFRDADLKRAFQAARPIQCSDLVTDKGEWREVAFFNENRKLGDWYRTDLEELKNDLAGYTFKGLCGEQRRPVQVTTKFPVEESVKAYESGKIRFQDIDVKVNAPVSAVFDPSTQAYVFDLPYLFRETGVDGAPIYSLNPRRPSDRYASDVTNRWECKAVRADDVTYQFLICQTSLVPRGGTTGNQRGITSFGSSAYSILSDGNEAFSTVKLTFETPPDSKAEPGGARSSQPQPLDAARTAERTWRSVPSEARLTDVGQSEFRLRFTPETWKERAVRPQWIADGMVANSTATSAPPRDKNYCLWRPGAPAVASRLLEASRDDSVVHTLEFRKQDQSTVSAEFEMRNDNGLVIGILQCSFLQSQTPDAVVVGRWLAIVGTHITLEAPVQ